jgi:hypothetical protein
MYNPPVVTAKKINPDELLSVSQAAEVRGTSRQAINYLVRLGKLPTIYIAGKRFITRQALEAYTPDPGGRPSKPTNGTKPPGETTAKLNKSFRAATQAGQQAGKMTTAEKAALKSEAPQQANRKKKKGSNKK